MKLFPVHISDFKLDGGAMFGVVPKILWQKKYPCDENNYCNWALRSLLFDNGKQRIMVDNGYGDKQDEKFFSFVHLHGGFGLESALGKYGYKPEDITDMVISHLHYDHCGGGVKNSSTGTGFEMVFPNATYWVSKQQWEWAKTLIKGKQLLTWKKIYFQCKKVVNLNSLKIISNYIRVLISGYTMGTLQVR